MARLPRILDRVRVHVIDKDYARVARMTDLGSAAGANGLVLCETYSVYLGDESRNRRALDSIAWYNPTLRGRARLRQLAEALVCYGYADRRLSFVVQVRVRGVDPDTWGAWADMIDEEYGRGAGAYYAAWRDLLDDIQW